MNSYAFFKLFHVAVAIWFIAGLLGRQMALTQAAHTTDVNVLAGWPNWPGSSTGGW